MVERVEELCEELERAFPGLGGVEEPESQSHAKHPGESRGVLV